MKQKKILNNVIAFVILLLLLFSMGSVEILPWWVFTIPVILFGMIGHRMHWKIAYFRVGFLSGFVVWFGINVFYDLTLNGLIYDRMALLLSLDKIVVLFFSGITGGLLTGLALYTGGSIALKGK